MWATVCHSQRAGHLFIYLFFPESFNVSFLRDVCVFAHCHRGCLGQDLVHGRCSIKYCLNEYMSGFFLVGLDGTRWLLTLLEEGVSDSRPCFWRLPGSSLLLWAAEEDPQPELAKVCEPPATVPCH